MIADREQRLRRVARSRGYQLLRFVRRDSGGRNHRGFLLVDTDEQAVVLGAEPTTLQDVENFLMDGQSPRQKRRRSG